MIFQREKKIVRHYCFEDRHTFSWGSPDLIELSLALLDAFVFKLQPLLFTDTYYYRKFSTPPASLWPADRKCQIKLHVRRKTGCWTAILKKGKRKALVHCIEIYCTSPSPLQCCKERKGLKTKMEQSDSPVPATATNSDSPIKQNDALSETEWRRKSLADVW